jgi:hypothetical protein
MVPTSKPLPGNVSPVTVPAAMEVLQLNPVPDIQFKALADVLHEGTACPDGVVAVSAPRSVLAVCVASCAFVALPEISLNAGCVEDGTPEVEMELIH